MFVKIILNAFVALIGSAIIPGIDIPTVWVAIVFAIVLGLLNATLGNLLKLVGCGINLLTFGIFDWLVNAGVILLAGRWVEEVYIDGWWPAIFLALLMAIAASLLGKYRMDHYISSL